MAMLILQSFDKFDVLAEFDPSTNTFFQHSKAENLSLPPTTISGVFAQLGKTMMLLYRFNKQLYLQIADHKLEISNRVRASLIKADFCTLIIKSGEDIIFRLEYLPLVISPPLETIVTPFAEEEDFDFGLFVHNIINDPGRSLRVFS